MIISLTNPRSTNDGTEKRIYVFAVEDANGGNETLNYTIIDQHPSAAYHFKAGEAKEVFVVHTASGTGEVRVEAVGSPVSTRARLQVDRVPGDDGSGT
jgi:hypothetical protein